MLLPIRSLLLLLMLWLPALQAADSGWLQNPQNDHAQVRLRADASQPEQIRLLLDVELQKGWKTYWRSPGEGGIAPEIRWQDNPAQAQWFWPTPQRFTVSGLTTQGYHHRVSIPIVLPADSRRLLAGTLTLSTCSNVCILTDYPFSLDLSVAADALFGHDFAEAMGRVPIEHGVTDRLHAGYSQGQLQLIAERETGWQQPELFFDGFADASLGAPAITIKGSQLQVRVPVTDQWGEQAPDLRQRKLSLVIADQGLAQQTTLEIGEALALNPASPPWWQLMLLALAGGFILNLMPCVLPVLAMKLGTIIQTERRDRRSVRLQFLASTSGILLSFMALALMMTLLRLGNHALGWGIQFQNPWFIALMLFITLLFSINLFGWLYLRLPSSLNSRLATYGGDRGLAGHFWQGAFATLLATPCSAPFLGTAVAVALVSPLPMLWGIFLALGVGMSLPWIAIALWPRLALSLPRPGRWMNQLRVLLGLLMLASSAWLLSLLSSHIGSSNTLIIAALIAVILLALQLKHHGGKTTAISAMMVLLIAAALLFSWRKGPQPLQDNVNWQPLTEQAITQALAEHKRVFIDVTADWCITCKANKYHVLLRDDVQQALQAEDVIALRGDWSHPSAPISAFLQRRGSVAVPFNQIYGPGLPQGKVLSPLLDRETLMQTLNDAKGEN